MDSQISLSSSGPFETVQNLRSTAITEQCCVCLGTTSYGREELNECLTDRYCLHTMKLNLRSSVSESPYSGVRALCLGSVLNFTALFRDRAMGCDAGRVMRLVTSLLLVV